MTSPPGPPPGPPPAPHTPPDDSTSPTDSGEVSARRARMEMLAKNGKGGPRGSSSGGGGGSSGGGGGDWSDAWETPASGPKGIWLRFLGWAAVLILLMMLLARGCERVVNGPCCVAVPVWR